MPKDGSFPTDVLPVDGEGIIPNCEPIVLVDEIEMHVPQL